MKTVDFDYYLPPECIAQTPVEPRHASRLMVLHRVTGIIEHTTFYEVGKYFYPGDLLVINRTRVIPARLWGKKTTGGKVELLLLKRTGIVTWEVMVGGKGLFIGRRILLEDGLEAEILREMDGSRRIVSFNREIESYLEDHGQMPLPPYIHTPLTDPQRYQTVYAKERGSVAAPTAGLHFTPQLIGQLDKAGIQMTGVLLHVGLDTFAPVTEDDPREHEIHTEWCEVNLAAASAVNLAKQSGRRVIAVGTTSIRTLETAALQAKDGEYVGAFSGPTSLFIIPGFAFRVANAMITNFHLPKSTLLMLVSAFADKDMILYAYNEAIKAGYRFYSFGDAMLIL